MKNIIELVIIFAIVKILVDILNEDSVTGINLVILLSIFSILWFSISKLIQEIKKGRAEKTDGITVIKRILKDMASSADFATWVILVPVIIGVYFLLNNIFMAQIPVYLVVILIISLILVMIMIGISLPNIEIYDYRKKIYLKKIPKEFVEEYRKLYDTHFSELEKLRKTILNKWMIVAIFGLIYMLIPLTPGYVLDWIMLDLPYPLDGLPFAILYVIPIGVILINMVKALEVGKTYKKQYKENIAKKSIQLLDNSAFYNENVSNIAVKRMYKNACFEDDENNIGNVYADDYVRIKLDESRNLELCDLYVTRYGTETQIFCGVYANFSCRKNINSNIKMSKNNFWETNKVKLANLDSNEFEKYFDVHADDRILAARIFTAEVMNLMMDFYNKYKLRFDISVVNNEVNLRFFTGNLFEARLIKKSMNVRDLYIYHEIINFVKEVAKNINKVLEEIEI